MMEIFHHYGTRLNEIELLYNTQKESPPIVRDTPPVSGNIQWARMLQQRIEDPMLRFQESPSLMASTVRRPLPHPLGFVAAWPRGRCSPQGDRIV